MKCCDYDASDLKHRIVIEQLGLTPNDSGGDGEAWTTFTQAWAKIITKTGNERYFAQRIEELVTHEIVLRYQPGITATMRVNFQGRIFEIKSAVDEDENHKWILIKAYERTGT